MGVNLPTTITQNLEVHGVQITMIVSYYIGTKNGFREQSNGTNILMLRGSAQLREYSNIECSLLHSIFKTMWKSRSMLYTLLRTLFQTMMKTRLNTTTILNDSISRTLQTSEQNFDQSTYKKVREENISDFMTKVLTIQPNHNVIEDDEGRLAGESNQAELL
jgi:hypothetical protein